MDQQIYSNKIVSLHLEGCSQKNCPHFNICYLQKRKIQETNFDKSKFDREYFLKKNYLIYEAICNKVSDENIKLLETYNNYNITLSYNSFILQKDILSKFKKQLQITVYNEDHLKVLEEYQKLYLVKDSDSLKFSIRHSSEPWNNIHYTIDMNYISKDTYLFIMLAILKSNSKNITIDSCADNVMNNNQCVYKKTYIDINYDGTIRRCPFQETGVYLGNSSEEIEKAFDILFQSKKCKYLMMMEKKE